MKTILIYWDAPEAKSLAQRFRDMKHRAQLRNPRLFDGSCEPADLVCVEFAAAAPAVVAAYRAKGVEVQEIAPLMEEAKAGGEDAQETPPPPPPAAAVAPKVTEPNTMPSRFDAMSDDEIRAYINEAGKEIGVAAHPRAGRAKLLAQAKLLDQKAS